MSNPPLETQQGWDDFRAQILSAFQQHPPRLVLDVTASEEHAQVISLGIIQPRRVFPPVWKVMPGQNKWDQGLGQAAEELFKRLAPHLTEADGTLLGERAFGCFAMVELGERSGWHSLLRICAEHTGEHWSAPGRLLPTCQVSALASEPGKRFYGHVRLWQEQPIETNLSA